MPSWIKWYMGCTQYCFYFIFMKIRYNCTIAAISQCVHSLTEHQSFEKVMGLRLLYRCCCVWVCSWPGCSGVFSSSRNMLIIEIDKDVSIPKLILDSIDYWQTFQNCDLYNRFKIMHFKHIYLHLANINYQPNINLFISQILCVCLVVCFLLFLLLLVIHLFIF